jgi:hypothetical protein
MFISGCSSTGKFVVDDLPAKKNKKIKSVKGEAFNGKI